jgi:hypothetical protein
MAWRILRVACPTERYLIRRGKPSAHQAISHADRLENVHSALLQNTGAMRANIVGIPAFKDDVVHAIVIKNLSQQKAGGASAGDNNLSSHCCSPDVDITTYSRSRQGQRLIALAEYVDTTT